MGKDLVVVDRRPRPRRLTNTSGTIRQGVPRARAGPAKKKLSVDVENGFLPEYEVIKDKAKIIAELKKLAQSADKVYLAPDPDREGEAIAWHVAKEIKAPEEAFRVFLNEITKRGVAEAMKSPVR